MVIKKPFDLIIFFYICSLHICTSTNNNIGSNIQKIIKSIFIYYISFPIGNHYSKMKLFIFIGIFESY